MARRVLLISSLLFFTLAAASPSLKKTRASNEEDGSGTSSTGAGPVTCPGFPGYCSESYPGDTCLVVCAFGRNNVPECQPDGTWTDAPRCIEHEPGDVTQKPGLCPGIPGYCSLAHSGELCEFDCITGDDIKSFCTPDGTWSPYPTCKGDIRETKDGCDPCPGPFGGARNRNGEQSGGNTRQEQPAQPVQQVQQQQQPQVQQPVQPARLPPQQQQHQQPQQQARPPPTVIQPARQTGFSPAPQPPIPANNNRNSNSNNNKQPANANKSSGSSRQQQQQSNNNFNNNNKPQQQKQQQVVPKQVAAAPQQTPAFSVPNQNKNPNNNSSNNNNNNNNNNNSKDKCPGDSLEGCIDVCPSFSARIFGACVGGCAKRCPGRK